MPPMPLTFSSLSSRYDGHPTHASTTSWTQGEQLNSADQRILHPGFQPTKSVKSSRVFQLSCHIRAAIHSDTAMMVCLGMDWYMMRRCLPHFAPLTSRNVRELSAMLLEAQKPRESHSIRGTLLLATVWIPSPCSHSLPSSLGFIRGKDSQA